jgi:hypothetical protein
MLKSPFMIISLLVLSACATTHPGNLGKSETLESKLPLKVSAEIIDSDNASFQLIQLTVENTSENWLKIDKATVKLDDPATSKVSVVLGSDLKYWAEAASTQQREDQHNMDMVKLGLLGVGTTAVLVGGSRGDQGLATAGSAVVVGTYSWALYDVLKTEINDAQRSSIIPENHLYHSTSIPSKMHLRRWVLLNKPANQAIKTLAVEFETVEGEKETYAIDL